MSFMGQPTPIRPLDFSGINNAISNIKEAKQNEKRNALYDLQIERATNEMEREKKSNALAEQYSTAQDENQKQSILKQWAVADPKGMQQTLGAFDALDSISQQKMLKKASTLYNHVSSVMNDDGTLNVQSYNAKAPAYGLPQIDGQNVTPQMIMSELKQAEMQIVGIQEYAKEKFKTQNELAKEDRKSKNELSKMGVEYGYRQSLQDSNNAHDFAIEDKRQGNRVALKQTKGADGEAGFDAQTKEKISFAKTKINSLTQQLNATFDKEERKQLQSQINAQTKKVNDLLGDNEEDSTMTTSKPSWSDYDE